MTKIQINDNTFHLLPEKAIFWEDEKALLAADLHIGKSNTFRASGIPVPDGSTKYDLERIAELISKMNSKKLFILGDFFHSNIGLNSDLIENVIQWSNSLAGIDIILIKGNHDSRIVNRIGGEIFDRITDELELNSFLLKHQNEESEKCFTFAGHIHPAVKVNSNRKIKKQHRKNKA